MSDKARLPYVGVDDANEATGPLPRRRPAAGPPPGPGKRAAARSVGTAGPSDSVWPASQPAAPGSQIRYGRFPGLQPPGRQIPCGQLPSRPCRRPSRRVASCRDGPPPGRKSRRRPAARHGLPPAICRDGPPPGRKNPPPPAAPAPRRRAGQETTAGQLPRRPGPGSPQEPAAGPHLLAQLPRRPPHVKPGRSSQSAPADLADGRPAARRSPSAASPARPATTSPRK